MAAKDLIQSKAPNNDIAFIDELSPEEYAPEENRKCLLHQQNSRSWNKLRTTLKFTGLSKQRNYEESLKGLSRRDSFIERFSTQRSHDKHYDMSDRNGYQLTSNEDPTHGSMCNVTRMNSIESKCLTDKSRSIRSMYICNKSAKTFEDEELFETEMIKGDCCLANPNYESPLEPLSDKSRWSFHQRLHRRRLCKMANIDSLKRFGMSFSENFTFVKEKDETLKINECTIRTEKIFFLWDPQGNPIVIWLTIVSIAFLYNIWIVIARQAFRELHQYDSYFWNILDVLTDIVYAVDIVIQLRTSYREYGLAVFRQRKLAKNYIKSRDCLLDVVALLPVHWVMPRRKVLPIFRSNRFLKIYRFWEWKTIVENRTVFPNIWRVFNLLHILLLGCHWFGAFYYLLSEYDDFKCTWGYPDPLKNEAFRDLKKKYLISFYWAALTLTTIGSSKEILMQRNPLPDDKSISENEELWYTFTIVAYFLGVFIFATIVGQVGNIITNRNATRLEFESILDKAKNYMRLHNVPTDMQKRVLRWYDYAWSRGRTHGGGDINQLELLPDKLKTEMALHVNLKVLKKVYMFQECRPEFLHDLVLKMRPYIFTPGDYICRTGEVARELFIIADGVLEVINDQGVVLTKMGSGDFFGEIGILNLDEGMNKRTANVKAVGYVELFVLHRNDVLEALKEHPDAEKLIIQLGTKRLIEIKNDRNKNKSLPPTPSNLVQNMDEPKEEIQKKNSEPNRPSAFFSNLEEELFDKIRKEKIKMIQEKDELLSQIDNMKNQIKSLEEEIEMYRSKK